jgi:hypothetical protein
MSSPRRYRAVELGLERPAVAVLRVGQLRGGPRVITLAGGQIHGWRCTDPVRDRARSADRWRTRSTRRGGARASTGGRYATATVRRRGDCPRRGSERISTTRRVHIGRLPLDLPAPTTKADYLPQPRSRLWGRYRPPERIPAQGYRRIQGELIGPAEERVRVVYNSCNMRARWTASRRFLASSLRYTARWWVLTVLTETYNSDAISLLERLLAR